MKTYRSFSPAETTGIGERLGKRIRAARRGGGSALVLALIGDLGSGKTTFVQGFLKGLRARGHATSPTFVIMRRHPFSRGSRTKGNAFHIDAYRLRTASDLRALDFGSILGGRGNIVIVEWAEKVKSLLPKRTARITFRHGRAENERRIAVSGGL